MKIYRLLFIILSAAILSGCRKESPDIQNPNEPAYGNHTDIFESFWNGMNNSYIFWDIDPTDWDEVYRTYKPQFEELDKQDLTLEELAARYTELYTDITKNIIDHHYALTVKFKGQGIAFIYPGEQEVMSRDYYHEMFDSEDLQNTILTNKAAGRISEGYLSWSGTLPGMDILTYNIDGGIIYLRVGAFNLSDLYYNGKLPANSDNPSVTGLKIFFNYLHNTPNIKGVIIDVRQNPGGYLNDLNIVLGQLISEDRLIGYSKHKNGLGRLDYTPWVPEYLHPAIDHLDINVPIVALADVNSASMAETVAFTVSRLPNGCFIGERTFGASGTLTSEFRMYYAGSFDNGVIETNAATSMLRYADGVCHEGIGITPDIECRFDDKKFENGIDNQLERAIEYIKTGR